MLHGIQMQSELVVGIESIISRISTFRGRSLNSWQLRACNEYVRVRIHSIYTGGVEGDTLRASRLMYAPRMVTIINSGDLGSKVSRVKPVFYGFLPRADATTTMDCRVKIGCMLIHFGCPPQCVTHCGSCSHAVVFTCCSPCRIQVQKEA